jgi:hypothetical protein
MSPGKGKYKTWWKLAAVILLTVIFATTGMPLWVDLAALVFFFILGLRVETGNLLLMAASFCLAILLCETILHFMPHAPRAAYRPHEMFLGSPAYKPLVDAAVPMPHGDLIALDVMASKTIIEPRTVRFRTDSLGFRNDADYHGQKYILAGDSMVVGSGTDQADILPNVLRNEFGMDAYSVAFTGYPADYCRMVRLFLNEVATDVHVLLFIFEGNDVRGPERVPDSPNWYDRIKIRFIKKLDLDYPRYVFNFARRAGWLLYRPILEPVEVFSIGGKDVGFYGNYVEKTVSPDVKLVIDPGPCDAEIMKMVRAVFFIPTKYRVYARYLPDYLSKAVPEPSPGLMDTRRFFSEYGIPVIDLTPAIRAAADDLLSRGRYVFWRDDTHWNGDAVRASAEVISDYLRDGP